MGFKIKRMNKILTLILLIAFKAGQCAYWHDDSLKISAYQDGRPYTRWWWHAMKFTGDDIRNQLIWIRDQGFGGVEISFIYPVNRDPEGERFEWLGEEWQQMVVYAKHCADSLGLGCDFTYGTLWPFGGTFVSDEDRTMRYGDTLFKQPLRLSWTHPDTGNVLNHMSSEAFRRYADVMSPAFEPAMKGSQSALFCDSWEVHTRKLWTPGFENKFEKRFGYDIIPYMDSIYEAENDMPRYDYMKLVAELVLNEFFIPWHEETRRLGGITRAQVMGSPTDLIRAYAVIDVPETEAMLYEPNYANIVASAAALSGKPVVSSESFTCLYGWPREHMFEEQTADLKMVADALFANGVNQHVWHGTPFNPIGVDTIYFYATVHVGERGNLTEELIPFNAYLARVSNAMRFGRPCSDIAVYLPLEDAWIAGILPEELQMPWSWGAYEMRYEYFPEELEGYHPLWINAYFLNQAKVHNGIMLVNDMVFEALYVDVSFLDLESLQAIYRVAREGLPVCLKNTPAQAGKIKSEEFNEVLARLLQLDNVHHEFSGTHRGKPLVEGENLPEFWARTYNNELKIFFSNPTNKGLKYPLAYGQSLQEEVISQNVTIHFNGQSITVKLDFEPYQSLLLHISSNGDWNFEDIRFIPKVPVQKVTKTETGN
jgi:hypothetical protein